MKRVYFIRRADGQGPIKIGCSDVPDERLYVFAAWHPYKLAVIAAAPGGFNQESALHRYFDASRVHGEWFDPTPELEWIIARVIETGALPKIALDTRTGEIAALYLAGQTLQQIGDRFEITRERARQILRDKAGIPSLGYRERHRRTPDSTAETHADLCVRLSLEGKSNKEIAEQIGDYHWNVRNALIRRGVQSQCKGAPRLEKTIAAADECAELYLAGVPTAEIARRLGTHQPSVYRLLRIKGVTPQRRPGRPCAQHKAAAA